MTEGTKSYLIGCHQFFIHPLFVCIAWKKEYGKWPKLWEIVCIFLHDIGIIGRQYISDDKAKNGHWILGAKFAQKIFPTKEAYELIAGHTKESGYPESKLARPDKTSFFILPLFIMWWNYWIEGFSGITPTKWRILLKKSLNKKGFISGHQLYIESKR